MASTPPPSDLDPVQLEQAKTLWHNFGKATKWGIILVVIALVALLFVTY